MEDDKPADDIAPDAPAEDAPPAEDDAPAEDAPPAEDDAPTADAVALADALESISTLAGQVAELTAEKVRLQAVNYSLLEQVSAGDTVDDLIDAEPADDPADDNPESVDDALESHRVKD